MNKYDYNKLTPFKWFILENFPLIDEDFDALTNWQLFCKLGKEINKIINSQNNVGEQMENVTNAFIALQDYVDNYFNNLDVQDEINNKLDDMAESGELENIIAEFLQTQVLFCYDNIEDLKDATNLPDGGFAKIAGYYTAGDGGESLFKIKNSHTSGDYYITLDNGLYAILLHKNETINIKQFGVKGDNETNDTMNFQLAINYCSLHKYTLFIPNGTYLVDFLEFENYLKMFGESKEYCIIKYNNLTQSGLTVKEQTLLGNANTSDEKSELVDLENLTFDGNRQNITDPANIPDAICGSIYIANIKDIYIFNCNLKNSARDQLRIIGADNSIIENCYFINSGNANVVSANNAITMASYVYNFRLSIGYYLKNKKLTINNCNFDTISDEALALNNVEECVVENCTFTNIGDYVIEYYPTTYNNQISNPTKNYQLIFANNFINNICSQILNCSVSLALDSCDMLFENNKGINLFKYDPYNRLTTNSSSPKRSLYYLEGPLLTQKVNITINNNSFETTEQSSFIANGYTNGMTTITNNYIKLDNTTNERTSLFSLWNDSYIENNIILGDLTNITRTFEILANFTCVNNTIEAGKNMFFANRDITNILISKNRLKNTFQYGALFTLVGTAYTLSNMIFTDNVISNNRAIFEGSGKTITNLILTNNISNIKVKHDVVNITNEISDNNILPT